MHKTIYVLVSCMFLQLTGTHSMAQNAFVINGSVPGVKDSTILYLDEAGSIRKRVDSTYVRNGRFRFTGSMPGNYQQVRIITAYTKGAWDYKSFWLEPGTITLNAPDGKLRAAVISGSSLQNTASAFAALTLPYEKAMDSLAALREKETNADTKAALREQLITVRDRKLEVEMGFVRDNPASVYSAYILDIYSSAWGKDKTADLYSRLTADNQKSSYGLTIAEFINLSRNVEIGGRYADFTQPNGAGTQLSLSSLVTSKEYVLLDFWASWCGPCREDNPQLVSTYAAFKDKGFEILGISLDDNKDEWLAAIRSDRLTWPNVSDLRGSKNRAALMYNITGIPNNYLIDKNGRIVGHNLRGQKLHDKLAELLK